MSVMEEDARNSSRDPKGVIPVYTSSRRSTALNILSKQTSKPKLRTPYPSYSKKFIAVKKTPGTVLNIDVKSLVNATTQNKMESSNTSSIEIDEDLQENLFKSATIVKPFSRPDANYDGVWMVPRSARPRTEKNKEFEWEKPKIERRNLVESASKYQAEYLQKVIKEKEKEMKLIVNQLLKSNSENVRLLEELDGFRGKNYDELYKENIVLKEQIARACRKNVLLAGQLRKRENTVLKKRPKTAEIF